MKKLARLAVLLSSCMPWQNWHLAGNSLIACSVSYSSSHNVKDAMEKYPQYIYLEPGTKVSVYGHYDNGKTGVEIKNGVYEGTLAYCPTDKIIK